MSKSQGRWRFRFSLKSLLIAMTIAAVALAIVAQPLMEDRRTRRHLNLAVAMGAKVSSTGILLREQTLRRIVLSFFGLPVHLHLYRLDFSGTKLTDIELGQLKGFREIRELDLGNTQVTDNALASLKKLEYLRVLDISGTQVTDQGIQHLLEIPSLASLNVTKTLVTYAALEKLDATLPLAHFCEEKAIAELEALGVQVVAFPRHGFEGGVAMPDIDGILDTGVTGRVAASVIVGMNRQLSLDATDLAHLCHLASLSDLDFHSVTLSPGSQAPILALIKRLPKLKRLSIYVINLTDQDLESIGRQTQLEELMLGSCVGLTDEGLSHLSSLKQLKKLSVTNCNGLSTEALSQLEGQLPNCQCEF